MSAKTSITEWIKEKGSPVGTLLLAAVIVGASIGSAARAHADPVSDAAFLALLDNHGITYASPSKAITAGYGVCTWMGIAGETEQSTIQMVQRNTNLGAMDAFYFVRVAENAYCPWFLSPQVSQTFQASAKVGGVVGA